MTERIAWLENEITKHDAAYWEQNNPLISDEEYDLLVEELRGLAPDHALVNRVVPAATGRQTVKHERPMLSLQKAYSPDEIFKWMNSVARSAQEEFNVSPKFDGVACEASTERMVTRGDGETGEVITDKLAITDFSIRLTPERGELVVLKSDLAKIKRSDGTPYKTCRSAAAGLINLKDTDESLGPVLKFMPHSSVIGTIQLSDFINIDWSETLADEQAQDYPVDGLVISLADKEYGESLGNTGHHPRHSIAFKISNPTTTSKLIDVEWQVAKTRIAPVAILEPTELDGVTISRATLHNLKEIERLGVRIGSKVQLMRAGSVIPAITQALSKGTKDIEVPAYCPACGALLENDGQDLHCPNPHCGGTKAKKLRDSLVRLEIEDCGPAVCSALVDLGFDLPSKVLRMSEDDWLRVPGFAARSAEKMRAQMLRRLQSPIDDYRVLAAMNFDGIGLTNARKILDRFTAQELGTGADLSTVEGIGVIRAESISFPLEWAELMMLLNVRETKGSLSAPRICFTGKSETSRDEWVKLAESRGYVFSKTVTKALDLLVVGDLQTTSNKAEKARKYGIRMMTYEQFLEEAEK